VRGNGVEIFEHENTEYTKGMGTASLSDFSPTLNDRTPHLTVSDHSVSSVFSVDQLPLLDAIQMISSADEELVAHRHRTRQRGAVQLANT